MTAAVSLPTTTRGDWASCDPAWTGIREETIDVRGHPVTVLRHDATGPGTPQLFVHGLGGSACNWLDVLRPLSAHGATLAVDLPGFGTTQVPAGGSARVPANAGFLGALLAELGWDRVVLFGNSMGGLICTLAAARHPQVVRGLVLVNPALPAPRRHMWRIPTRAISRVLPAAVPGVGPLLVELVMRARTAEELIDDSFASVLADVDCVRASMRAALVDSLEDARIYRWRRRALVEAASSLVAMLADGREALAAVDAVTVPTLLLWGDADRLVSPHVIAGLVERRSDWDQHVFGGIGHAPMLEAPDVFVEVVTSWYARHGL